jgi:hypothetical protein
MSASLDSSALLRDLGAQTRAFASSPCSSRKDLERIASDERYTAHVEPLRERVRRIREDLHKNWSCAPRLYSSRILSLVSGDEAHRHRGLRSIKDLEIDGVRIRIQRLNEPGPKRKREAHVP